MLALAACTTPMPRHGAQIVYSQAERQAKLALSPNWAFKGRLAVNDGGNAGNARIEWTQTGTDFSIRLSAPITGQSWQLRRSGSEFSLEGLEGGPRQGDDAESLLKQATGWRIPVNDMVAWVRGQQAGDLAQVELAPNGLPANLAESGWSVEYRDWNESDPPLPTKLFARKGQASVRLAIEHWAAP